MAPSWRFASPLKPNVDYLALDCTTPLLRTYRSCAIGL
jgi:hypothetical protein